MTPSAASLPENLPSSEWLREIVRSCPEGTARGIVAWAQLDLDEKLNFGPGLLFLTMSEAWFLEGWQGNRPGRKYLLRPDHEFRLGEQGGTGWLRLCDHSGCIASWRFTLACLADVQALVDRAATVVASLQRARTASAPADGGESPAVLRSADPDPDPDPPAAAELQAGAADGDGDRVPVRSLLRLWRFARPYRRRLVTGFALTLASTAATLVPPYLTMPLMDDVLIPFQAGVPIDPATVGLYLGGLLLAALFAWVLGWARTWVLAQVSEQMGADLRTTAYEHLLGLSLAYFGGKRTGDLMARIGSETDRINIFLSLHLLDFATDVLMIVMTAVILVSIDPLLALVTLAPLPLIVWLIYRVREHLRIGFDRLNRIWAEITSVLADTIPGIRVVKAFAQEEREAERFRAANEHNRIANDQLNRVWALFSPSVTLATEVGLLVVWAFGIWQVARGRITVGVLTAFLAYIGRFYTRLDSMSRIVTHTQKAAASAKRIFEILDHVSSVPEPREPAALPAMSGRISVRQVDFRYGSRTVLHRLDLEIAPGEMIGLVGRSGSGKSTLVNLILRFHDPDSGAVLVDGIDIRTLRVADYRRQVGLVLQEPFLFYGTVAENIAYGKPQATRAEIVAAARAAHAHDFILRLPQGYDSLVGERGQTLSGGERQRISIARALLIDPRILILDEATSSVDTTTEQEIRRALDNLVRGRTTIAIAHRLSTLYRADRIVVLDAGRVVEQGTHEELMRRRGAYFALVQAQRQDDRVTASDDGEDALPVSRIGTDNAAGEAVTAVDCA